MMVHYWPIVPLLAVEYVMGRQTYFRAKSIIEFVLLLVVEIFVYTKWVLPKQGE